MSPESPTDPTATADHYRRQLQVVCDNATVALFIMDERQYCTFMNRAAEEMTGYSLDEVQGRPLHDVIHHTRPDGSPYPLAECPIDRAFPTRNRMQGEEIFVHKDGHFYPVAFTASPIRDGNRTVGTIIEVRDLSREQEREGALRASEGRYHAIVEATPECVKIMAPDGKLLEMNAAGLAMIEADPSHPPLGLCVYDVIAPEDREAFRAFNERICQGQGGILEFDIIGLRGTRRRMETHAVPLPGPDGTFRHLAVTRDVTARRRAEEAIRRSEERFRRLFEQSPLSIQVLAPDGRTIRVNRAWEQLWGIPADDKLSDYNLRHDAQLAQLGLAPLIERAFTGETVQLPLVGYSPDRGQYAGQRRWVRAFLYPVKDDHGQLEEVVLFHEDITDRRRAEDAQRFLAEAGEVLSSSLDYEETLAAVAHLVVPRLADWCTVHVQEPEGRLRQLAVAHADPEKVVWARELARRYPADPNAPHGVAAVVRTGEPELVPEVTDEMLVRAARDPDHLTILRNAGLKSVVIAPLAARGRTLGAITFIAAETGRRYGREDLSLAVDLGRRAGLAVDNARLFGESQEALRLLGLLIEASDRLTRSLAPSAVQAGIIDLSHRLVAADAHAIWRRSPSSDDWIIVQSAGLSEEYVREQGRISVSGPMPDRAIVAEDAIGTTTLVSRAAAYRAEGIVSLLAVPLRIHGVVSGTLVFYYRTRRRFDEVTVRVASALADLAGAALGTADLYEREQASRRRAEEADRRKDEFLAMLAHELRNPLAPLRNSLQILQLRGGDPTIVERVREIMDRQVTHLSRLVDDLLDVSRITLGKVQLRTERLDLVGLARQVLMDHEAAFRSKGITLRTELPPRPLWLNGDPTRLAQVLDNLLTNARKFTAVGGEVAITVQQKPDGIAEVAVRDTGAGIDAEMLPRLFEAFSQADRTLDRSAGGLGLGLAIVKGLAELHGGNVRAESDGLGQGATFTVTLPAEVEAPALRPGSPPLRQESRRLRVLVVEDNRDSADSLRLLLESYGYEVTVAYSGPDGVRAAETHRPEVVLCDIGLPGMDGYHVARALRGNPATAAARLIALTGYGQEEDRQRAKQAGFDEHLTKPADPAALDALISAAG